MQFNKSMHNNNLNISANILHIELNTNLNTELVKIEITKISPVSYTHLDVYKRQVIGKSPKCFWQDSSAYASRGVRECPKSGMRMVTSSDITGCRAAGSWNGAAGSMLF